MVNFFYDFCSWINQNVDELRELFADEFKIYDVAQQIYKGDLGYAMMYNNPDIPNEVDWEACWSTEDFAPVFYWFNQKYNNGDKNPIFDRDSIRQCLNSYDSHQEIYKTDPQKWEMLAKKVANYLDEGYNYGEDNPINYYLIGECQNFYEGVYMEDDDDDDY